MDKSLHQLIKKQVDNYTQLPVKINTYYDFNMHETIEKIDAYMASRFLNGDTDAQGRRKFFENIVVAPRNKWKSSTDIDRQNIRIKSAHGDDFYRPKIFTGLFRDWMNRVAFGNFLNQCGETLATYSTAVTKIVEKDGDLHYQVIPFNRLVVDPINFHANPKIEKLEYTTAQLRMNPAYDQVAVENLIEAFSHQSSEMITGEKKDYNDTYIQLWEVHGNLPVGYLKEKPTEKDWTTFTQQMHVIAITKSKDKGEQEHTLYSGREKKDPYRISYLVEYAGRTLGQGPVEMLFEAQEVVNTANYRADRQLELASMQLFQTSDPELEGTNVLSDLENGIIIRHSKDAPLTQVNNTSHDVNYLNVRADRAKMSAQEITGTPDVLMGKNLPSGTAWRQAEILNREANDPFQYMMENKAHTLEAMLREDIIPFYVKKLKNMDKELVASFTPAELAIIDEAWADALASEEAAKRFLSGELITPEVMDEMKTTIKGVLTKGASERFIKSESWAKYWDGFEYEVEVEITGESSNKEAALTTLNSILAVISKNPQIMTDPTTRLIMSRALEESGTISPVELPQPSTAQLSAGGGLQAQQVGQPVANNQLNG